VKRVFCFILCLFASWQLSHAQGNVGVHAGYILQGKAGVAMRQGDILTELCGTESKFLGAFYQHELTSALIIRSELNYYANSLRSLVRNNGTESGFCDGVTIGNVYYSTFEVPATINLMIPVTRGFGIGVLAGFGLDINVPLGKRPDYSFGTPTTSVADVMNSLEHTPKTLLSNYTCGVRFSVWRITLVARYQHNLSSSLTNNLHVRGNEYVFDTNLHQLHFSAGYNFHRIKFRKEK
jgi:hypothetical protein